MTIINDTRFSDTIKLVRKLGQSNANAALTKPKFALEAVRACGDGFVTVDDGGKLYDAYIEGRNEVLSKNPLGTGSDEGGGYKANVSKVTQLLKATALKSAGVDFADVLTRATNIRDALGKTGEKIKPCFDAYVDLARAQIKAPEAALADDAITSIVRKAEREEKDELAKLVDLYKRTYKMAEAIKIEPMAAAVTSLGNAIAELGGEVPAMNDEEKEEQQIAAFLGSKGYTMNAAGKIVKIKARS